MQLMILIAHIFDVRYSAKLFTCVDSFNSHNNPMSKYNYNAPSADEESETKRA